jgi:nitroreductase
VNAPVTPLAGLTDEQTRAVLAAAAAAPSLYGTQPWRLEAGRDGIGLHLDLDRLAPVADPDRQQALLACGAVLLNLRLAIRVLDRHTDVRLQPAPAEPNLLAVLRPLGHHPALPAEHRLAAVLPTPTEAGTGFRPTGALTALRNGLHAAGLNGWRLWRTLEAHRTEPQVAQPAHR